MKSKAAAIIEFITVFGLATASTAMLVAGLASAMGPVSANSASAAASVPVVRLPTIVVTAAAETAVDQPVVATTPVGETAVQTYRLAPIVITGKRVSPGSAGRTAVSDKISSSNPLGTNPVGSDVLRTDPAFSS